MVKNDLPDTWCESIVKEIRDSAEIQQLFDTGCIVFPHVTYPELWSLPNYSTVRPITRHLRYCPPISMCNCLKQLNGSPFCDIKFKDVVGAGWRDRPEDPIERHNKVISQKWTCTMIGYPPFPEAFQATKERAASREDDRLTKLQSRIDQYYGPFATVPQAGPPTISPIGS